jgi:hypothetical protein
MKSGMRLLLGALCLAARPVPASSGTDGAAFLDIPVGAGPAALGSAYSALAKDAYAPIYNPAGLGFVAAPQLSAQHLSYLQSINYEFGSVVIPLGHATNDSKPTRALGASIQYLGSGDIAGTDPSGASIGNFSSHYATYSIAYGQKLMEKLSIGLTGKAIDAKIADALAHAYAADLGALFQASDRMAFSATFDNLGSKLTFSSQKDSLPEALHLGAAYRLGKHWSSTVEGVYNIPGLLAGRVGAEWRPLEAISIRAGYRSDTAKQLSALAGFTAGIGVHLFGQEFAYAWLPYGDLGDTQYFSLLLTFGKAGEEKRNLIQYQTIKQHRSADNIKPSDPDSQQLMQLLSEHEDHLANSSTTEGQRP